MWPKVRNSPGIHQLQNDQLTVIYSHDRLSNKKEVNYQYLQQNELISKTLQWVKNLHKRLHTVWCHLWDSVWGKTNLRIFYICNHVYRKLFIFSFLILSHFVYCSCQEMVREPRDSEHLAVCPQVWPVPM